jgi:transcriptional regulator with XRE-family HTH domain
MDIGKSIRELRKLKKLSQEDLAQKAGITQAALSHIERGKRPGESTMEKISTALSVPVALIYLMSVEEADVPAGNADVYKKLFTYMKGMILDIADDPLQLADPQ